jgi:hypothetical protein
MLKKIIPILLALTVLLTACGTPAAPTMSPADVQGTAVSAAWTMVAATQAAIPTNTPLPPTEVPSPTPLPTFTLEPLLIPTLPQLVLPTATTAAASDPDNCLKPLNMGEAGPTNPMRIENESGGTIQWMSLNLVENAFGQCGALSYNNIGPGAKKTINIPKGTWYAWAGISYKDGTSGNSSGTFIIRIGDGDLLRIIVKPEVILTKP